MPGKKNAVFTIESQPNVYAFDSKSIKKYKELHEKRVQKFKVSSAEPDWKEKRKKIEDEYLSNLKKLEEDYEEKKLKLEERVNKASEAYNKLNWDDFLASSSKKAEFDQQAKELFPLPKIQLNFEANETISSGQDLIRTESDRNAIKFSINFTKADKETLQLIKNNVRTRFGKVVERSKEFKRIQDGIEAFDKAFNSENSDLGEDYLSSDARLQDMMNKLDEIKKASLEYYNKNKGFKFTKAGAQRAQMAKNAYDMAVKKIAAIQKARFDSKAHDEDKNISEDQRQFTNKNLQELYGEKRNVLLQAKKDTEKEQDKAELDYEEKKGALEAEQKEKLKALELEEKKYKSQGNEISSAGSFVINEKLEYNQLNASQQYAVNVAKFSRLIFEDKHNPFIAYKTTVPVNGTEGKVSENEGLFKNTMKLDALKEQLALKDGKFPMTYNTDALLTLANLQLYDTMAGVAEKREKNDYSVDFEFVKGDIRLPASALKAMGAEKLAAEGYACIVTGVKAKFIVPDNGKYCESSVKITDHTMIPAETAARIANLDKSYVANFVFEGADSNGVNPGDAFGRSIDSVRHQLDRRADNNMLYGKSSEWERFNVIGEKALKRNIATDNVDFRPARPPRYYKNKEYRFGIVRYGWQYFDKRLMRNLKLNINKVKDVGYEFDTQFNEKLLSEKSLLPSDKSLRSKEFDKLVNSWFIKDQDLKEIISRVKEISSMGVKDVLHYDKQYLTPRGFVKEKPEINFMKSEAYENDYDRKASELYKLISEYTKSHENELSKENSPAYLLNQWKDRVYPKSNSVFDLNDPNCKVIDATSKVEDEREDVFNGDGDYLLGANLFFGDDRDYWEASSFRMRINFAEMPTIHMKDFKDEPLFTREPSVTDIKQGRLGNCYFLAYITSQINANPNAIKDMIHDNGDGTVTCKFFNDKNQPTYIKINKTVPYFQNNGPHKLEEVPCSEEKAPLWFHLLQKAYILSGMRPLNQVSKVEADKIMDKIQRHCRVGNSDDPNVLKDKILAERFKALGDKGKELIAKNPEKLYNRLMNHLLPAINGGFEEDVYQQFTGEKARVKKMPPMNGNIILSFLNIMEIDKNPICGDRLKNITDFDDRSILSSICQAAAKKLTLDKTKFSTDMIGQEFVETENVNLDDVLDAINEVTNGRVPVELQKIKPEKRKELGEQLANAIKDYQMNEPNPESILISRKSGQYSAAANNIFNTIKGHIHKGHGVSCGFLNKTDKHGSVGLEFAKDKSVEANNGVFTSHAFSVLGYKEVGDRKILYVRNPWGKKEKAVHNVTLNGPDGKEEISYSNLADEKEDSKDAGVFEMELNDFVEYAHSITFGSKEHSLNYFDVVNSLSSQYLKVFQSQDPKKYDAIVEAYGYEKLMEKTRESNIIQDYAEKVLTIDDISKDIEDGKDLDPSKLQQLDEFKKELSSIFVTKPSKTADLEKSNAIAQKKDEIQKGGAGIC